MSKRRPPQHPLRGEVRPDADRGQGHRGGRGALHRRAGRRGARQQPQALLPQLLQEAHGAVQASLTRFLTRAILTAKLGFFLHFLQIFKLIF